MSLPAVLDGPDSEGGPVLVVSGNEKGSHAGERCSVHKNNIHVFNSIHLY